MTEFFEQAYDKEVDEWLQRNNFTVTAHLKKIIIKILMFRDEKIDHAGGFITAFINNDLRKSFSYADLECRANMHLLVMAYSNVGTPCDALV